MPLVAKQAVSSSSSQSVSGCKHNKSVTLVFTLSKNTTQAIRQHDELTSKDYTNIVGVDAGVECLLPRELLLQLVERDECHSVAEAGQWLSKSRALEK